MIFGENLVAPTTTDEANWLSPGCHLPWITVGNLMPTDYSSYLRVYPPSLDSPDWRHELQSSYTELARIGERHTSTPDSAWFALWEGHGFEGSVASVGWPDAPVDDDERSALEAHRAAVREESLQENARTKVELATLPRFALPHRTYYLLHGSVDAVAELRTPPSRAPRYWHEPDLFWPHDRGWFAATDVGLWSFYVGGTTEFIAELVSALEVPTEIVTPDYIVPSEA